MKLRSLRAFTSDDAYVDCLLLGCCMLNRSSSVRQPSLSLNTERSKLRALFQKGGRYIAT